jgi:diguanylate cyclase (GGDEF)-like protein
MERAVEQAARAACDSGRTATSEIAGSVAIAQPLATEANGSESGDVIVVGRDGRPFSAEEQALFGYLAGQLAVAMENVALHERVRREARIDELTGLANHRHFQETLAAERERMRRFRRPLGLVMVDIDHFKTVNDTYGHQQGDEVLRHVAVAMRDVTRAVDTPARYGGEELAVVLPETGLDGAHAAGEQIRRAVEAVRVPRPDGPPLNVTVSVGVAAADPQAADPASLIAAADAALYEAKRGGRNRTVRAGGTAAARFTRRADARDV